MASQVRLGSHLGHLGRLGERQGRVWAPTEPREDGAAHAGGCEREGGPLRRLQKPDQTALGILARLNVPWGTVADFLASAGAVPDRVSGVRCGVCGVCSVGKVVIGGQDFRIAESWGLFFAFSVKRGSP